MNTMFDLADTASATPVDTSATALASTLTSACQHCGAPFEPRSGSGGKPQKFCSEQCRRVYKPNARQCGPTPEAQPTLLAAPETAPAAKPREPGFWSIPRQDKIEVCETMSDNEIEIIQRSPLGDSDDTTIIVARPNAVALARQILWAAGFQAVCISVLVDGGYVDLEDNDMYADPD